MHTYINALEQKKCEKYSQGQSDFNGIYKSWQYMHIYTIVSYRGLILIFFSTSNVCKRILTKEATEKFTRD